MEPLPASLKPMMSNGYGVASEDPKPFELVVPVPAPDGSLSITGSDMAPFMIAHLQNGKYSGTRITIIRETLISADSSETDTMHCD